VLEWLVRTHGDVVPLVLRLTLAVVMFAHGAQKVLGLFGGSGLRGTLDVLRKSGVPSSVAVLTIMAEFLGPLASRWVS
jgi:putative oxidoreductase